MFLEYVRSKRCPCGQGRVSEEPERPEREQCGVSTHNTGRAAGRSVSRNRCMWGWGLGPKPGNFQMKDLRIMKICPHVSRVLSSSGSANLLNPRPCSSRHPVLQSFTILLILLWMCWGCLVSLSACNLTEQSVNRGQPLHLSSDMLSHHSESPHGGLIMDHNGCLFACA